MKTTKYGLVAALGLLALAAPRAARADEIYQFSITDASGRISAFSFSFTVPAFLAQGDTPTITSFTITSGATNFTFVQALATNIPSGTFAGACFVFGTASTPLGPSPSCNFTSSSSNGIGSGGFLLDGLTPSGPLPSANGTYTFAGGSGILIVPAGAQFWNPRGTLVISSTPSTVPEPSSLLLLGTGLLGLMGMGLYRKRLA